MSGQYHFDDDASFVIEDYQHAKPFANFFPGVAGLFGIPMWAFYVNRGQGVASFGIESKDKAILEFQPANKAYRLTPATGFRTFLNVHEGDKIHFYEAFANSKASAYRIKQRMILSSHDMTIVEENLSLGLEVRVNYFTMPQENYAALVRRVTIINKGKKNYTIDMLDGLPAINPFGLSDWLSKHMSRTVEAWMTVKNLNKNAPFYQLKVVVADTPQVTPIHEGNFYFAFDENDGKLADMAVEASLIFGQSDDFLVPENFKGAKEFVLPKRQESANRTPSAMSVHSIKLDMGKAKAIVALAGYAHDVDELNAITKRAVKKGYINAKQAENKEIIEDIKQYAFTQSGSKAFDQYCGQTFLDNILRGGLPISLQTADGPVVFNVYSRKHGDLERDYNFFTLSPTYLSQGNGNFRDVNQNRRNDIYFNADLKDTAIVSFFNLSQADGYNPLVVKGVTFSLIDASSADKIVKEYVLKGGDKLKNLLLKGFMPGDLLKLVSRAVEINTNPEDFLSHVMNFCRKQEAADPGEAFWSDHWTYNIDLVESYLSLYPENLRSLLLEKKVFQFYLNDFYVLPRDKKYVLTAHGVRQYHAVEEHDKKVEAKQKGHRLRVKGGNGDVYETTLLAKLICLLANKAATLDPSGIGIEMEANKPNWYDALNGLPGLLGSSISETFELQRYAQFTLDSLDQLGVKDLDSVTLFVELADFAEGLTHVLTNEKDAYSYWQKSGDLKEHYRQLIRYGIDGKERKLNIALVRQMLKGIISRCQKAYAQAVKPNGLFATYFYHEVNSHELLDKSHHGDHHVRAKSFVRHELPLFLEGFVHAMRVQADADHALKLHQAIKKSPVYDKKLKMYKVNADLTTATDEIGRTRIFPRGWLENESIWLHMEYKYLLELLRNGLAGEFYQEIKTCLVPFMEPEVYGRSILENSSFIASSAHEDTHLHGRGFVARLSGSTAEFLHIWLLMAVGPKPFVNNAQGELELHLNPLLPSWLFTSKAGDELPANTFAFNFLGKTLVVYHNPKRQDTFGDKGVAVTRLLLTYADGKTVSVDAPILSGAYAHDVRDGRVIRIDAMLA